MFGELKVVHMMKRTLKALDDALKVLESGLPLPSIDELAEQGLIRVVVEADIRDTLFRFQRMYAIHSLNLALGCIVSDVPRKDLDTWLSAIRTFQKAGGSAFELPLEPDNWVTSSNQNVISGRTSLPECRSQQDDDRLLLNAAG